MQLIKKNYWKCDFQAHNRVLSKTFIKFHKTFILEIILKKPLRVTTIKQQNTLTSFMTFAFIFLDKKALLFSVLSKTTMEDCMLFSNLPLCLYCGRFYFTLFIDNTRKDTNYSCYFRNNWHYQFIRFEIWKISYFLQSKTVLLSQKILVVSYMKLFKWALLFWVVLPTVATISMLQNMVGVPTNLQADALPIKVWTNFSKLLMFCSRLVVKILPYGIL